jgi:hypothetical protein
MSFAAASVAMAALTTLRSPPARVAPLASVAGSISRPIAALSGAAFEHVDAASPPSTAASSVVAPPPPAPSPARSEPEGGRTELELLARAQAAYSGRDFARAITLIGELSRRFPNGHLAEEREALRVRSLIGIGSADQAGRAATAFARRFPRSVLLPNEGKR